MDIMVDNKNFSIDISMDDIINERAGNIDSIVWGGRYGGSSNASYNMRLGIAWSSVAKSGYSAVTARLWVESAALQTGGIAKKYAITINGTSTSGSKAFNQGDWNSTFTSKLLEYTVNVTHSNATNITIAGSFAIEVTYAGVYVGTMSHNITASLPQILTAPPSPGSCSASGKYEKGQNISVSWGSSSTATGYDIEYDQYLPGTGWKGWGTAVGYSSGTSMSHAIGSAGAQCLRYRVRAKNSAGTSGWSPNSGNVYHYGVRVNNGGYAWGRVRVWNGSSWVEGIVKVWNGSSWIYAGNN